MLNYKSVWNRPRQSHQSLRLKKALVQNWHLHPKSRIELEGYNRCVRNGGKNKENLQVKMIDKRFVSLTSIIYFHPSNEVTGDHTAYTYFGLHN